MHTYLRKPREICTIIYPSVESYTDYYRQTVACDDVAYHSQSVVMSSNGEREKSELTHVFVHFTIRLFGVFFSQPFSYNKWIYLKKKTTYLYSFYHFA